MTIDAATFGWVAFLAAVAWIVTITVVVFAMKKG